MNLFTAQKIFVKRAHGAQSFNYRRQLFRHIVDVSLGSFVGNRKPERAMCFFVGGTNRKQNMRRLKRSRGASRACRGRYTCAVEQQHKAFAFYKLERYIDIAGQAPSSR